MSDVLDSKSGVTPVVARDRDAPRAERRDDGETLVLSPGGSRSSSSSKRCRCSWGQSRLSLSFRPKAIGGIFKRGGGGLGSVTIQDFLKDRAEYDGGANLAGMPVDLAKGALLHWLTELESSVASGFLFGEKPSIADFSVYHPIWFLRNNPVNAPTTEAYPHATHWLDRIEAFGHGRVTPSDGEAALAEAKATEPRPLEPVAIAVDAVPGDPVRVTPTDVARVPVTGELVRADAQEFAVRRTTAETGAHRGHLE